MGCMLSCLRVPRDDLYVDYPDQRGSRDRRQLVNSLILECSEVSSGRMSQARTASGHEDSDEQDNQILTKASKCSSDSTEEEDHDDECPICLEVFEDENPGVTLLCDHQFHLACIYAWMERSAACPYCQRTALLEESFC